MTITLPGDPVLTVKSLLKAPTVIQKRIITPDTKFLSDLLFRGPIPTPSGTVRYQAAELDNLYAARGDVEQIEPGSEYPMLDFADGDERIASTAKFGAGFPVTYEAERRNDLSPISRGTLKVRNHLLRKDAQRSMSALELLAPSVTASAKWNVAKAMKTDVLTAVGAAPTGYDLDTIIVSKKTATAIQLLDEYQNLAPRENTALNPLFNRGLAGLWGLNWIINDAAGANAYLVQQKTAGFVALEEDTKTRVIDQQETDRYLVLTSRLSVPVVDEPGAVAVIKGVI